VNNRAHIRRKPYKVHYVDDDSVSESEDDYLFTILHKEEIKAINKRLHAVMQIEKQEIRLQLDCGAAVNVLPENLYKQINRDNKLNKLSSTQQILVMYNGTEIKPVGKCILKVTNPKNKKEYNINFMVIN